jgi:hypothetical protein
VKELLKPSGVIIAVEPARDLFSMRNALVAYLIRQLLSMDSRWYQDLSIPETELALDIEVKRVLEEYQQARDIDEAVQSPMDNSTGAEQMLNELRYYCEELSFSYGNTLVPRLVGGIRGVTELEGSKVARFIKLFDNYATTNGLLEPGAFYFAGRIKGNIA